jgi:hypothetical protein
MSKKMLSLALALVLCLGLTLPACAAEKTDSSVNAAGSTTVTDTGGKTHTLSNPVLYTMSGSDIENVAALFGDALMYAEEYCSDIDVIYAVAPGTVVTAPEGMGYQYGANISVAWTGNRFVGGGAGDGPLGYLAYDLGGTETSKYMEGVFSDFTILGCTPESELSEEVLTNGYDFDTDKIAFYVVTEDTKTNPFASAATPSTPETPETPSKTVFTDVAAGAYYEEAVAWAVAEGITSGTTATTFSPNDTCTFSQILTFLWRANGSPEPTIQNPFSNIKETAYFYKPLLWAVEQKLIGSDTYEDGWPCTRGMTVFFMWKASGAEFDQGAFEKQLFDDVPLEDSNTFVQPVYWAVKNGVTSGTSATTFSPEAICTRGQIVTFLYRGLAK